MWRRQEQEQQEQEQEPNQQQQTSDEHAIPRLSACSASDVEVFHLVK